MQSEIYKQIKTCVKNLLGLMTDLTDFFFEWVKISPSMHPNSAIQLSIHPSVHLSIWSSIYPRTQGHKNAGRVAHTHIHTCSATHTLEHAHTYAYIYACSPGLVAQLAAWQICKQSRSCDIEPKSSQITSVGIGHEVVSTAILFLLLNQVQHFSLTGKSMCSLYW